MLGAFDDLVPTTPATGAAAAAVPPQPTGGRVFRAPDGSLVPVPDGTSAAQVQQTMSTVHAQPGGGGSYSQAGAGDDPQGFDDLIPQAKSDFTTGFVNDFLKPGANVVNWLGQVPGIGQGLDAASRLVNNGEDLGSALQDYKNYLPEQAAKGLKPSMLGSVAGSVAGTAPLGLIGGGAAAPAIQGALGGALLSDGTPQGAIGGAIGGSVVGGIGGMFGNSLLQSFAPTLSKPVQTILSETPNFPFTMGTVAKGSIPSAIEAVGKISPFGGEMIRARGNDMLEAAARGAAQIAKDPKAPAVEGETGFELQRDLKEGYDQGYKQVKATKPIAFDQDYWKDASAAHSIAQPISQGGQLPDDLAGDYANFVKREIGNRIDPSIGGFTPQGALDAKAAINAEIRSFSQPGALGGNVTGPSRYELKYVKALEGQRDAIKALIARKDPAAGARLAELDNSYPAAKTFENAVVKSTMNNTTPDGFFNPQQLVRSVRDMGTKSQVASNFAPAPGVAPTPFQRLAAYAQASKDVLPKTYKDVSSPMNSAIEGGVGAGVVGSEVFHGGGPAIAGAGAGLAALYTRPVQQAIVRGLIGNAGRRAALEARLGIPLTAITTGPAAAALGGMTGGAIGPSVGSMIPFLPAAQPSP